MKYLFLVGDGMADELLPQLKNRTPLEVSDIPNMRRLAREGRVGMCRTIPEGMHPLNSCPFVLLEPKQPFR